MLIDTTLRNRWNLPSKRSNTNNDEELVEDNNITDSFQSGLELGDRFRVTAQEWLPTWRILEE